jgi:hypothetical protein
MNTLIVHPKDETTRFLCDIYKDIPKKTIIEGGITRKHLRHLIGRYDRIIACGHGTRNGLCANNRFLIEPNSDIIWFGHVIDDTMAEVLSRGHNNIYIWCHADKFVQRHKLKGFYSGMFISEVRESIELGFADVTEEEITELNRAFAEIVGEHINEPIKTLYKNVMEEYGVVARRHPIGRYNWERLYLSN